MRFACNNIHKRKSCWIFRCVRKIAKSDCYIRHVCLSVLPSVHMKQLGSHWTDFHEIWYLSTFQKSVEEFQVSWNLTRITGTLRDDVCTFMIISCRILIRMRSMADKTSRENQTHIFRKSCRLWDNVEKCGKAGQATDDNVTRRMRFACWITKATNTHS
jgi:hypothetical protein